MNITLLLLLLFLHYYPAHTTAAQPELVNAIAQGLHAEHFRDFFTNRVTSARIGRKFYEDVVNGIYPHISLVGTKASEGYICS